MFHRSSRTWSLVLSLLLLVGGVLLLTKTTLRAQQPEYWVDTNQHVNRWPPPGQAWPLRRIWGVDSNEFWLSAYVASYAPDTAITGSQGLLNYQNWWRLWTDTVGLKIVETRDKIWSGGATYYSTTPERIDAIVRAARPKVGSVWGDRLIITPNHFDYTGSARELVLFPFDTNNSALWHAHFTQISGGTLLNNGSYYSLPHGLSTERVYDSATTTSGQVVLSRMLVGYDSTYHQHEAVATLAGGVIEDSVYNGPNLYFGSGNDNLPRSSTIFGLRGHLYDVAFGGRGVSVGLNDTLFFIDVYTVHLIGASYYNPVRFDTTFFPPDTLDSARLDSAHLGHLPIHADTVAFILNWRHRHAIDTAHTLLRFPYASLPVLKRDLLPKSLTSPIWDEFREAAKPLRLFDTNALRVRGPFDPASASRDFDISIRWTGKEKAALRLVTIRDTMTHLLFGPDTAGNRGYRTQTLRWLNRMLVGPLYGALDSAAQSSGDSTHLDSVIAHSLASVIRVNAGDEGSMLINAGFTWCDSTLYRYYAPRSPLSTGDSVTRGFRAFRAMGRDATVQASQNELVCEMGYLYADYNTPPTIQSIPKRYDTAAQFNYVAYGVAAPRLMAIREHNGGSFGIPELALNSYDIARNTDLYQRSLLGWYSTGRTDQFYDAACRRMGQVAAISRQTGRPLIVYQGTHTTQHVRWVYDSTVGRRVPLPLFLPTHEPSQIRLSANLGLCYGARGLHFSYLGNSLSEFNDVVGMDSGGYAGYPMRMTNYDSDWGPIGPTTNRREDYLDTLVLAEGNYTGADRTVVKLYRSAPGDSVYMGWGVRMEAVKWLTQSWVPTITPALMKLRWRDCYSISFTDSLQLTVDTNINHHVANPAAYPATITSGQMRLNANAYQHYRPIPSNEIIQGVRTYDRWGNLDSISRTYVEVGLFDPILNTQPLATGYDTNYVYVVNRRTFERSGEISATSPRGKVMDSLAEWRKLFVQLNMSHPDLIRYNYVRVREQPGTADTTRAPWWNASRTPLDTVVNLDSAVALWMRPGGGALLQITYVKPGDFLSGVLAFNNAKRVFFDGIRYHAVITRFQDNKNDTTSFYDQIYYYWSQPVDSVERVVRWYGPGSGSQLINYQISGPCDSATRWQNRTPALTVRRIGDSALVTIVWTSHPNTYALPTSTREVMTRSLLLDSNGTILHLGDMRTVGYHRGSFLTGWSGMGAPPAPNPSRGLSSSFWGSWGTPVVSTLNGAEVFAWSDSVAGIVARLRTTGTAHVACAPVYWSNYDTVSKTVASFTGCTPGKSQWPTMPPVAHIASLDSNVGIAWQNSIACGNVANTGNVIYYKRLVHSGTPTAPVLTSRNDYRVSPIGFYEHPSLDLWQDVWYQCFEGIAWEEKTSTWPHFGSTLWFRPLATETRLRWNGVNKWNPFWDSIEVTSGWAYYSHVVRSPNPTGPPAGYLDLRPSVAPLNEVMLLADTADTAHFAIAYVDSAYTAAGVVMDLWQTQVQYGTSTATPGFPKRYSFSGFHPAMSGTGTKQETRAAMLYERSYNANTVGNAELGPTHQFFARLSRPRGYLATGREVMLLDEGEAGATVGMMDLWVSDDDSSRSLPMTARASTRTLTDTLAPALDLVRSAAFTTHDSVAVGVHARAQLAGDSGYVAGAGMSIHLRWELVEESSGSVVAVLDSATVDAAHPAHDSLVERVLDVVSGSYCVRMTADTVGITPRALSQQESRWPVVETSIWVDELAAKLVRTGEAKGATMRLDVQPNPATDHAEVMVSVPKEGAVRIVLHTVEGRAVGVVYAGRLDRGRYSVPVALSNLAPGVYMVELVAGRERLVRQLIVR